MENDTVSGVLADHSWHLAMTKLSRKGPKGHQGPKGHKLEKNCRPAAGILASCIH
jgi:hypothetical protein